MRYVLLLYEDEPGASDDTFERRGLRLRSILPDAPPSALTVRVRRGRTLLTSGPWPGTGAALGGIHVIDARDLNDAVRAAARLPEARLGGVEVRPVREPTGSEHGPRNPARHAPEEELSP